MEACGSVQVLKQPKRARRAKGKGGVVLTILNRQRKIAFDVERLRPRLDAVMQAARVSDREVTLVLVSDANIRRLNRTWRGIDAPTDCLSFPALEGEGGEYAMDLLGDIVISLETAQRQSASRRPLEDEVLTLFVHSLLHLLGYDHSEPTERKRMQARTRALLKAAATSLSRPPSSPG